MNNNESEKWRFLLAYICSIEETDEILIAKKQKKIWSRFNVSNTVFDALELVRSDSSNQTCF